MRRTQSGLAKSHLASSPLIAIRRKQGYGYGNLLPCGTMLISLRVSSRAAKGVCMFDVPLVAPRKFIPLPANLLVFEPNSSSLHLARVPAVAQDSTLVKAVMHA